MRWIWIDKFVEFTPGVSAAAIKNISLAEEHLHDLHPDFPIMPNTLLVEGMAQTAGLLVGDARQFAEKVVLAKIGRATFHQLVGPGQTVRFEAKIEQISDQGASTAGAIQADGDLVAEINLMFSHVDQNMAGMKFPEHNFVFTPQFQDLLRRYRIDPPVRL